MEIPERTWTPSFRRWKSNTSDRLKIFQKVVLHKLGNVWKSKGNSKKLENLTKKSSADKNEPLPEIVTNTSLSEKTITTKDVSSNNVLKTTLKPHNNFENTASNFFSYSTTGKPTEELQEITISKKNSKVDKTGHSENRFPAAERSDVSATVQKLVEEKFKDVLNSYHRRRVLRLESRKKLFSHLDHTIVDNSNIIEEVIESRAATPINCQESIKTTKKLDSPIREQDHNLDHVTSTKKGSIQQPIFIKSTVLGSSFGINSEQLKASLEKIFDDAWSEPNSEWEPERLSLSHNLDNYSCNNAKFKRYNFPMLRAVPGSITSVCDTQSVGTSDVSTLITKSVRTDFSSVQEFERSETITPFSESSQEELKEYFLIQEHQRQFKLMIQTSKALNHFVARNKYFTATSHYLDLERSLLVATQKFEAVQQKHQQLQDEQYDDYVLADVGQVKISNLAFILTKRNNHHTNKFTLWFIAIISHNTTTLDTQIVTADEDGIVRFPDLLEFEYLSINFEIDISIYMLEVKNYKKTDRNKDNQICPSPYKILSFNKSSPKPQKRSFSNIRLSSFILCGKTTVNKCDLGKHSLLRVLEVSHASNLRGTITMNLASGIKFPYRAAFLTIGSKVNENFSWNRRWIFLDTYKLKIWNDPLKSSCEQPLDTIDLSLCVNSSISQADRKLCARPHTLLLETRYSTLSSNSSNILQHYLSADNTNQMKTWEELLNSVLSALRTWNCRKL